MNTEVVLSAAEARTLTDQIKTGVDAVWHLIVQAYLNRAWDSLGYASWDDYCTREFGTSRLALPREDRQEIVGSLREAGLSGRAIAAATGVDERTVRRDLNDVRQNAAPDDDELAEALIIGMDGKVYTPPPEPEPRRWTKAERDLQRQLKAGETVVVTLRGDHDNLIEWAQENDLYMRVDRRSDWGNPFLTPNDGDRDTVIRNYTKHYLPFKPSLLNRLGELKGKALGCWCSPEPCHADVLREWVGR